MNRFFPLGIAVIVLIIIIYSFSGNNEKPFDYQEYQSSIQQSRISKNRFLKQDKESPLPQNLKASFNAINYFPIDTSYRIIADFKPIANGRKRSIQMTGGSVEEYLEYGNVSFSLVGKIHQLLVLKSLETKEEVLFLPFFDQSNGITTYGGGRYLDPEELSNQKMLLDFNQAYNPYCAYSEEFACPIPPLQNRLDIPIPAGEKDFELK